MNTERTDLAEILHWKSIYEIEFRVDISFYIPWSIIIVVITSIVMDVYDGTRASHAKKITVKPKSRLDLIRNRAYLASLQNAKSMQIENF